MRNTSRIGKKIDKKYKRPIDNLYSHRFYQDLFNGYAYSLGEKAFDRKDFFLVRSTDKDIEKLFCNDSGCDFSYYLEQTIDRAIYSMAVYGKAYLYVKPEYKKNDAKNERKIISLRIAEIKGIRKKNSFYYKTYSNEVSKLDISEGSLITLDLKDLGYTRNYFVRLVKNLGKCDVTTASLELINEESAYDFSVHVNKIQKRFLKKVSYIGWKFGTDGLSDSYILYKEIKMKIFKMKVLKYVLEKINKALVDNYIQDKKFKIEALTKNVDYEETWKKYKKGELTVSDLNKIVW
jgi:hypothetical protein